MDGRGEGELRESTVGSPKGWVHEGGRVAQGSDMGGDSGTGLGGCTGVNEADPSGESRIQKRGACWQTRNGK